MNKNESIGTITTRQCPTCGHHEVGYITHDGVFRALKPGDRIQILEQDPNLTSGFSHILEEPIQPNMDNQPIDYDIWVPEPIRSNLSLSMKYGVLIPSGLLKEEMTGAFYEMAYLQKMILLIDKEPFTSLSIILDRYFSAPNLATGNSRQMAQAIFQEIREIKEPVAKLKQWLEQQDNESLEKLFHPQSIESLNNAPLSDDELKKGLLELTLEGFFDLL